MGTLSPMNPLGHIINRQLHGNSMIRNKLFQERFAGAHNLFRKDLLAHYGCVNAIQFSSEGELLISGGDDRRVLLWSVPEIIHGRCNPISMGTTHISNIFCLEFDSFNSKIFSGGNDDQVIIHDIKTGALVTKLAHKKPVYGISVNPQNDFIIATACDDGRILSYDIRSSATEPICLAKETTAFHSVMYNPVNTRLLATANSEEGICLWDSRKPREALIQYDSCTGSTSGISVCFNGTGSRLLALRRRLPPVLYATQSQNAVCQFYHPQYYNSCTMKTCCFAGDNDDYVLSGSDDFNLFMWSIPKQDSQWGTTHMILEGHRSIVNQVCYNKQNNIIASSGVEKMVKLWSTLPIGTWEESLSKENKITSRTVYSHDDYITLVGNSGQRISHDYSDQSIQEDSRMMAFFDSLIQREIEGWNSPSEVTISSDSDSSNIQTEAQDLQDSTFLPKIISHRRRLLEENKKRKPNRIAQLIAQKRNRLAKMAKYKSYGSVYRHSKQNRSNKKGKNKNTKKSNKALTRRTYHSTVDTSSSTSHSEKENRRKHKLYHDKPARYTRSKRIRTRKNFKDVYENSVSNSSIDGPSTSTGITGSGSSVFRVYEQDSDDEIVPPNGCTETSRNSEENSFVNILPTPLNGTHDLCINALDMSAHSSVNNDLYTNVTEASTSSTTVKRSSCDSLLNYDTDSSDYEYNYTQVKKCEGRDMSTPDSGIATAACSSGSSYAKHKNVPRSGSYNGNSSDDEDYPYERFRKCTKKARLNIRKQIIGDSDSN